MEILLGAEPITAAEAWRIGLVNQVVPSKDLMATCEALARKIMVDNPLRTYARLRERVT